MPAITRNLRQDLAPMELLRHGLQLVGQGYSAALDLWGAAGTQMPVQGLLIVPVSVLAAANAYVNLIFESSPNNAAPWTQHAPIGGANPLVAGGQGLGTYFAEVSEFNRYIRLNYTVVNANVTFGATFIGSGLRYAPRNAALAGAAILMSNVEVV